MTEALDTPEKAQFHLVEFTFGDPQQTLYFTNWDTNIDPSGLNYVSVPKMSFDLAPNEGTFGENPTKIRMMLEDETVAFLDPLTRGTPFSAVAVKITEVIDPTEIGDAGSTKVVATGVIYRTRRNANGKTDLCIIEVRNRKTLLNVALGFQINAHCVWRLNGPGCQETSHGPDSYNTATVTTTFDGKLLTAADTLLSLDLAGSRTWTRGFIKRDGVSIGIFDYDKTQDGNIVKVFQLVRQPPTEWQSQPVEFFPGCTKQIDGDGGCRDAWDNEEGFGGSGYSIPSYNPITENPQG